jgi:CTP:molybdopterin cytidylyltransferase MocA
MSSTSTTAGLVLAAGASSRMGYPKALLPTPANVPLAVHQMRLLRAAGCPRVAVVLGAHAESIAKKITDGEVIQHAGWAAGRLTSLQAGLRALPGYDGYLILPVDTVGLQVETLARLLTAATHDTFALRPHVQGKPGRVLWISARVAHEILSLPASDTRLDEWLAPRITALECDDPAILNNVNTPDEWAGIRGQL